MIETLSIPTQTHGRVLVKRHRVSFSEKRHPMSNPGVTVVGFHGYAQSAEDMMDVLQRISSSESLTLVSVQALHRFYTRGDQKIVASWMTRQDREEAITDNVAYVGRLLDTVKTTSGVVFSETTPDVVFLGFSQGVAMAYRAALLGKHQAAGIVALGGDIPPDVKDVPAGKWPKVLVEAGLKDEWYTSDKISADEEFLKQHGVAHQIHRRDAGHEVTDEMLASVAEFIARG
jgi:predicted esterase